MSSARKRGTHEMTAILDKIAAGELLGRRQDMPSNQLLSHALEQLLARSKRLRDTEAGNDQHAAGDVAGRPCRQRRVRPRRRRCAADLASAVAESNHAPPHLDRHRPCAVRLYRRAGADRGLRPGDHGPKHHHRHRQGATWRTCSEQQRRQIAADGAGASACSPICEVSTARTAALAHPHCEDPDFLLFARRLQRRAELRGRQRATPSDACSHP